MTYNYKRTKNINDSYLINKQVPAIFLYLHMIIKSNYKSNQLFMEEILKKIALKNIYLYHHNCCTHSNPLL